ncbi:hypothetical protein Bpfe_031129 [Biomphalaria pfeifferi]|uniref:Uncharacterized protein n=1 Tax=Biomphalaria pfeifferi TaxID=112525 RepID=A0AAD8ET70_BIOPF|nr:hypothetical protein Bpfe_031129 [Biomphalaria pfeifferi]
MGSLDSRLWWIDERTGLGVHEPCGDGNDECTEGRGENGEDDESIGQHVHRPCTSVLNALAFASADSRKNMRSSINRPSECTVTGARRSRALSMNAASLASVERI